MATLGSLQLLTSPQESEGGAEQIQIGSGLSAPGGVDAYLQYNGITLNDRTGIEKYRIRRIDGLQDADIRDSREANPSRHGETAFDSYYGGRTITITGRIEAYRLQKLRDMEQALRTAFIGLEELPLTIYTANLAQRVQIFCKKSQPLAMSDEQQHPNVFMREFLLTLRASNPRMIGIQQITELSDAIPTNSTAFRALTLNNVGNFPAQPKIRINGSIVNPILTNFQTGEFIQLNTTIADGAWIEIDVAKGTVYDNTGANKYEVLDIQSDFWELVPGATDIDVASGATNANASIQVTYSPTWM